MKTASEIIAILNALIEKDGDLEIRYDHPEFGPQEIAEVTLEKGFRETVHHYLIH